jgi:hypothetical protein
MPTSPAPSRADYPVTVSRASSGQFWPDAQILCGIYPHGFPALPVGRLQAQLAQKIGMWTSPYRSGINNAGADFGWT